MVKAYVADWKKDEVSKLQDFVKSADVVGLVDVSGCLLYTSPSPRDIS